MRSPAIEPVKKLKRGIVDKYAQPDDAKGWAQVLNTLLPLAMLWTAVGLEHHYSPGVIAAITALMTLILLRVFVLMHECGHGSLFSSPTLNRNFGFLFGVISGMPQYVWAQHHNYHHATNGNWAKYRGPLAVLSTDEFDRLTPAQQRAYSRARSIWMAPLAGFLYLLLNPRINWIKGTLALAGFLLRAKLDRPGVSLREHARNFKPRYWGSPAEYWHMTANNLVLISAWVLMSWLIDPALFFGVYLVSGSLAGAAGIVLFTVQHNFEHSYASCDNNWCYDTAAIHGTSYLVLPRWLNWVTANIGYHHVHHLSARIPNYKLAECHAENETLFSDVRRLTLKDVRRSLEFLLWDPHARRIVSVASHRAGKTGVAPIRGSAELA